MGTLRRSTIDLLDADPTLFDRVLLALQGLPGAEEPDAPDSLVAPWRVLRGLGLTYGGFLAWVNQVGHGERVESYRQVLEVRAYLLVEDALRIADEEGDAQLKVGTRFKMARAYGPRVFGDQVAAQVTGPLVHITIGTTPQVSQERLALAEALLVKEADGHDSGH